MEIMSSEGDQDSVDLDVLSDSVENNANARSVTSNPLIHGSDRDEGLQHLKEFQENLDDLLGKDFSSLDEALKGLEVFKWNGRSPLAKNGDCESKQGTRGTVTMFRCEQTRCSFRLCLRYPFGTTTYFKFTLGQKGIREHANHKLQRPKRTAKYVVEVLDECQKKAALDGSAGLELQKKSINLVNNMFGGQEAMNEVKYAHLKRKLEKQKLQKRGSTIPDSFSVLIREGESMISVDPTSCDPDLLAVLGVLLRLQKSFPETYVNVCWDKHLSYVFFALPNQRRKGSLYGDLRLFDDKHGVSHNGYHLASCTVQGNEGLEIVACGLFDKSNGKNWKCFVEDCSKAFSTTTNGPKRAWKAAIADGDGCIESAVKATDLTVEMWTCWMHFDKSVRAKHLQRAHEWKGLHQLFEKLLTNDSERKLEILVLHSRTFVF